MNQIGMNPMIINPIGFNQMGINPISINNQMNQMGMDQTTMDIKNIVKPYEDKIKAVQRVLDGESYCEVSHSLGMPVETQVINWHRKYLELGWDGLKLDGRGRKRRMGNKPIKPSESKSQAEEIVELRKRLEYLEAENAYLKKLAALVQQRKAQEQKKK